MYAKQLSYYNEGSILTSISAFQEYLARIQELEAENVLQCMSQTFRYNLHRLMLWFSAASSAFGPKQRSRVNSKSSTTDLLSHRTRERAISIAKDTLKTPRAVLPHFDKLQLADKLKDAQIEDRLRPKRRKLPHSLTAAADKRISDLWRRPPPLAKVVREQVSKADLDRLAPGQWLNDEVINFYGAMVKERSDRWGKENDPLCADDPWFGANELGGTQPPAINGHTRKGKGPEVGSPLQTHYFNTFFYSKLTTEGYEKARLRTWTKRVDVFAKDAVLIPINLGNAHWTFACVNMRLKRIEYYDSLGHCRNSVYGALRHWLDSEHRDKKGSPFDFDGWEDYWSDEIPTQNNASDCGVFTCQFMEGTSRGEDVASFGFSQEDMPYLRRRMLWEISQARLAGWKVAILE
ncbi:cysteine proteinase [Clavulina sp. PMI_390]|nr:cysteine proteinase [Clavulina sp. PMI_390]